MSRDDAVDIGKALANITERTYSQKEILSTQAHQTAFKQLVALKEKEIEQEVLMQETRHIGLRKLWNILIWALVVTCTVGVLANVYNHYQSIQLRKECLRELRNACN